MMTSIAHRASGVFMGLGAALLALWLLSAESSPDDYAIFYGASVSLPGQIIVWLCVWSFAYHLLNGIRHLFWDFGYGFELRTAAISGIAVMLLSAIVTAALLLIVLTGHGGYYHAL